MAKMTNIRERVHQPFRDALIRTSGLASSSIQDTTHLFQPRPVDTGVTNAPQGAVLPSDQSMVILILRVYLYFRAPVLRSGATIAGTANTQNGDLFVTAANEAAAVTLLNGNAIGDYHDVHRLYMQASEQIFWTFGTGQKPSLSDMPSSYFPWGGGLAGDAGGATDIILWNNGLPSHQAGLRLGRAVLLPPRQNVMVKAQAVSLPTGGNQATFGATQGSRNMYSIVDNLNAIDGVSKVVAWSHDGLFSRDVQ